VCTARDDGNGHAKLQGKMYGISVLNTGGTHGLTVIANGNGGGAEHTVDIEGQKLYLIEVVVYH
jgi:hypothetical protein